MLDKSERVERLVSLLGRLTNHPEGTASLQLTGRSWAKFPFAKWHDAHTTCDACMLD